MKNITRYNIKEVSINNETVLYDCLVMSTVHDTFYLCRDKGRDPFKDEDYFLFKVREEIPKRDFLRPTPMDERVYREHAVLYLDSIRLGYECLCGELITLEEYQEIMSR